MASGASVAPTSTFPESATLLLLSAGNYMDGLARGLLWHNIHITFYQIPCNGSRVEIRGRTEWMDRQDVRYVSTSSLERIQTEVLNKN
jgi:hypothetical protein